MRLYYSIIQDRVLRNITLTFFRYELYLSRGSASSVEYIFYCIILKRILVSNNLDIAITSQRKEHLLNALEEKKTGI